MSSEGDAGGHTSTTTISTVAIQAGNSQIVVAVLKCGELVKLQLTEAQPNLLEIGNNQDETKQLLEEHEQLLTKLKKNEGGVWALLEEADKTAEEKKAEEQVYEAMAVSLSKAWKTLVTHLEKRKSLLILACHFFECALEFAINIDEAEDFQSVGQELTSANCMNELLQRHSTIRRGMLEKSMLVLNKSREFLEFLKDFQSEQALQYGRAPHGAWSSCGKVEGLMEILQDRRRQVDLCMRRQQHELEMIHHICQWVQQEQEVTGWFKEKTTLFLENNQLGSSLSENEDLLKEFKEFELKAKDWDVLVERLLQQASELLSSNDCPELQHLSDKSEKLKATHEQFWSLMMNRLAHLLESNAFYSSANKAFEVLGTIEIAIKDLKTQALSLPELGKKHKEISCSIKEASTEALQRGQLLLQKLKPQSAQVGGLQRMLGYIKERVEVLSRECHAHKVLTGKRQQLVTAFEELVDKVSAWIKNSNGALSASIEPGSTLTEAEDTLNKHVELLSQSQDVMRESEAIAGFIKELRGLESSETVDLSNKASLLAEEMKTLVRDISTHVEILRPYVDFLRSADEVKEQIRTLQECYKNRTEEEEENEGTCATIKEMLDAKWQSLLQSFFTMQDLGNNFINSSNMVSGNLKLNIKVAGNVVEKHMETLTKTKSELSDLWTSWQLHYSEIKSVKKQWKKIKDQLKKVLRDLRAMEEIFAPASKVDLGGDPQSVSKLQENFYSAKPQFLQLNAEIEFLVKTSELLALKGIPVKEKNERVSELLQLHQHVRDKIREYETVLSMTVKFHQLYQELDSLIKTEPVTVFSDASQARTQLTQHQERQRHIRHLYKLALSLGVDITSTVQQSRVLVLSVQRLQEKLERLERGSENWIAEANKCEEGLMINVHCCLYKEEISELRESFKDLKKKFNNLKFNYVKKNEKLRNLKAVKNQIQQIEIYIEKLQVLKKKLQAFTLKVSSSSEKHLIGNNLREIEDTLNELQRQVGDFDRTVEEYKQNLDINVKLQQALEEYQFWCDEASSTIVRVGKYSSQCKTKEAVSSLYKQFEKFVWPTIPQQEERISQITELAVRLHGAEEGKKYMEKTINKHHEIVESIKELSNGLLDLEAKLQLETMKQPQTHEENNKRDTTPEQKESGHTPEMTGPHCTKELPINKNPENKKPQLRKTRSQDLPDKPHPEHHKVLSEIRLCTQEAYSKTSKLETITNKSTIERKEEMHTSFTHIHTVNVNNSSVERDRSHILQQAKRDSQEIPPPSPPSSPPTRDPSCITDIQKQFQGAEKQYSAQKTNSEDNYKGFIRPHPPSDSKTAAHHSVEEEFLPHGTPEPASPVPEGDFRPDHLTEESLSNDEYECTSPDDISLPPLSETPESNIIQSENDLDDGYCVSSHSLRVNQHSHQSHSQYGDTLHQRRDWISSQAESYPSPTTGLGARFRAESSSFVQSPLTVPAPSLVSNTISSLLFKSKCGNPPPGSLTECSETLYSVHESRTEIQESVHDSSSARSHSTHATPTPLTTEQDSDVCKPTVIREEIRRASSKKAMGNLAAGLGLNFSKPLSNATVVEGSPVTLEVEVTGCPEPILTWFKNGHKLVNDEHIELSHKEGKHVLFIQSAAVRDSGQYMVTASNSAATVSSSSMLQVKVHGATPHFLSRPKELNVLVEEDLSSHCTYPQVHCLRDMKIATCGQSQSLKHNDLTVSSIKSVGVSMTQEKDESSALMIIREAKKFLIEASDYGMLNKDPENLESLPASTGTHAVLEKDFGDHL
ncbi:coiled-coil domain-containing protein 141 isoform X2 [Myxocyprinus asiaticus]|uniref:coiled-coil domain-containing protein 141 isoform X2 n=1 Tax=Myxocyprinus asiaticus TaxID=70543 RepID=UPI002221F0E7|nr:coiled-coil domain-containing protein 141 isoform X2 [Myxocyprinus asiaticus]